MGKKTDQAAAALSKEEKRIVLNRIVISIDEVEHWLAALKEARKFGLQKGKPANVTNAITLDRVRELVRAVKLYKSAEFKLDDMQDYTG